MNRFLECCELALKQDVPAELARLKEENSILLSRKRIFKKMCLIGTVLLIAWIVNEVRKQSKKDNDENRGKLES